MTGSYRVPCDNAKLPVLTATPRDKRIFSTGCSGIADNSGFKEFKYLTYDILIAFS